jgi:hypothetical protein
MRILRLSISVLMLVLWACSSHEELEPPDNPFDPGNPDYVSPTAEIISGPGEAEVINTTAVTFTWQGNETATEYSYQFDGSGWSEWTVNTSALFDYLDEGVHSFTVKARSVNGDAQDTPTELSFSVDAVAGPSALVYPYRQTGSPGDTLVYQIIAEEVTDLFAVECNITFDADYLELIEVYDGDILGEWGGSPLVIEEQSASSFSISMVAVQGSSSSFAGTTSLITIVVRVKSIADISSDQTVIEIHGSTYLNPVLETIDVAISRVGILNVQ